MISKIRGILIEKQAPAVVIESNGIGYEVFIPMTIFYQLPEIGSEISLFTHLSIREDAQTLYGFNNAEERSLFRSLLKVSGVGPKSALAILSGITPNVLVRYIMDNDVNALTSLPGVGKKTAERLVIEMRDRIANFSVTTTEPKNSAAAADAISALISLGYRQQEAQKAVMTYKNDATLGSEEMIRLALKELNKHK